MKIICLKKSAYLPHLVAICQIYVGFNKKNFGAPCWHTSWQLALPVAVVVAAVPTGNAGRYQKDESNSHARR
jgi:hypothetical protein